MAEICLEASFRELLISKVMAIECTQTLLGLVVAIAGSIRWTCSLGGGTVRGFRFGRFLSRKGLSLYFSTVLVERYGCGTGDDS